MIDLFNTFGVNLDLETQGKWIEFSDAKFLIARHNNDNFLAEYKKQFETNESALSGMSEEDAKAETTKLLAKIYAKTILLGWQGKIGFKGKLVTYSEKAAAEILGDPQMKEFFEFIHRESVKFENFRADKIEELEKN